MKAIEISGQQLVVREGKSTRRNLVIMDNKNADNIEYKQEDTSLLGYKGVKKLGEGEIIYSPYIPAQLPPEQAEQLRKQKRAGWTYATVSLEHPSASVRGKRGKVLDTRTTEAGIKEFCLLIDTINKCSKTGFCTWIGVIDSAYEKVWVEEQYIKTFEHYDDEGNEIAENNNCTIA